MQKAETQTARKQTRNPLFERGDSIGMNFLNAREQGVSKYYEITDVEIARENKKGETNDFLHATDLETGETGQIYVDGGIRGKFGAVGGIEAAKGRKIELIWNGKIEATIPDPEKPGKTLTTMVNDYSMFFLKNS